MNVFIYYKTPTIHLDNIGAIIFQKINFITGCGKCLPHRNYNGLDRRDGKYKKSRVRELIEKSLNEADTRRIAAAASRDGCWRAKSPLRDIRVMSKTT